MNSSGHVISRACGFFIWILVFFYPGAVLVFLTMDAELSFHRTNAANVDGELTHVTFFGLIPVERIPLHSVREAWSESYSSTSSITHKSSVGVFRTDWVVLATGEGHVSVTRVGTSDSVECGELAAKIDHFLIDPRRQSLNVRQSVKGTWHTFGIIGYVFFFLGAIPLLWPFALVISALRRLSGVQARASIEHPREEHLSSRESPRNMFIALLVISLVIAAASIGLYFAYEYTGKSQQKSKLEQVKYPERFIQLEFPVSSSADIQKMWLDCRRGNFFACEGLGFHYMRGSNVERDAGLAEMYFTLACDEGSDFACTYLSNWKPRP